MFCPIFCPRFIQVLSMSNICPNYFSLTQFCQIIVHILYKMFTNCPRVDLFFPSFLYSTNFGQRNVQAMSTFCPNVFIEILETYDKIVCPTFVKILSMSNCSNCVQFICSHTVLSVVSVICPTFVYIQSLSKFCPMVVKTKKAP